MQEMKIGKLIRVEQRVVRTVYLEDFVALGFVINISLWYLDTYRSVFY